MLLSLLCAALVTAATGSLSAQTQARTTQKPAPTPIVEQRYERPAAQDGHVTEVQERFYFRRPIVRLGQDYTLKAGETVRDLTSVLGDVTIEGHVDHDVLVIAGDAKIASTAVIDGSLVVIAGSVTVSSGASVRRDFVVIGGTANTPADFAPGGEHVAIGTPMMGATVRSLIPWLTRGLLWGRLIVPDLPWVWMVVLIGLVIGLLMNHVFDRQVSATATALTKRPISAFFMGLLMLLLMGPILAIVAASVIGLAVVPFAIAAVIIGTFIGKIAVARVIGRSVVAEQEPESRLQGLRSFVIGAALITVAYLLPVVGLLTWALVGVFGLGCATMSFAATLRRERPAPVRKAPVEPPPTPPIPPAPPSPEGGSSGPFGPSVPAFGQPSASAFVAADVPPVAPPPITPPVIGPAPVAVLFPRASFLDRVAAFALDVVLIAILNAVLRYPWEGGGLLVVVIVYQMAFLAWKGTTLGGIVCGLRVIRMNGTDMRPIDAVARGLSSIFSIFALGIGCLWMLNDPERQTWHDKIAGTIVVKVPRELVLA